MSLKLYFSFIAAYLLIVFQANAQNNHNIKGSLKDTTGKAIADITIRILTGKDTLLKNSDIEGGFNFNRIPTDNIKIIIEPLNYQKVVLDYNLNANQKEVLLKPIVLKEKSTILNEVIIKEKLANIVFKRDTVEYNAAAYQKFKEDQLEDLLNRLPGIQIDNDGNVTADGKPMNKIRVNGKDFFTGDIKQFLKQLPADIISKLQVIDDYGDEANFTGIKTGDPQKMLNLVIKPGMNRGNFGDAGALYSSNGQYGVFANGNYWLDTKQISIGGVLNKTNNQSGLSNTNSVTTSYRNTFNKVLTIYGSYDYSNNVSDVDGENFTESILNNATIFNNSSNSTYKKNINNNIKGGLEYRPDPDNYLLVNTSLDLTSGKTSTQLTSAQTGSIREDLQQQSEISLNSPVFNSTISMGHHFAKKGRVATFDFSYGENKKSNNDNFNNLISYYDSNGIVSKDSLLNLLINNQLNGNNISLKFTYSEPINKTSHVDFIYTFSQDNQNNRLITDGFYPTGEKYTIDSLSTYYLTSFTTHLFNINYRYDSKRLRFIMGFNYEPVLLTGQNFAEEDKIKNTNYNFFPILNFDYSISKQNTLGFNYNSSSVPPEYNQLSPTKDSQNLQNVIVGNPNLKPSFTNRLNLVFKHIYAKGSSIAFNIGSEFIQNKVVTNIVLIPDTLNTLKQETHFLNASGSYKINGGYYFSIPLFSMNNHKYNLNFIGNESYGNDLSFVNNVESHNRNLTLLQNVSTNFNIQKLFFNVSSTFKYSKNQFTTDNQFNTINKTLQFHFTTGYLITKNLSINIDGSKSINIDYSSALISNPLIVNSSLQLKIFKENSANIQLQVFDLFDETNNFVRVITDNTIIDSRTNYISRYFKLKFTMHLSKFGSN